MIRRLQMREILDWIDTLEIPDSEPIFITGDLNVEFNSAEYRAFLNEFPLGIDYEKDEAVGGSFSAKVSSVCIQFIQNVVLVFLQTPDLGREILQIMPSCQWESTESCVIVHDGIE